MRKPSRSKLRRQRQTEVNQELELMPMLNVFISIIPLLLLSAAFVQLAVIPTALPASAQASATLPVAANDKLSLSIVIQSNAYVVEANGATVSTIARPDHAAPGDVNAKAARDQLGAALASIAAQHPSNREVKIVADPATRYEDIIDVMDVSRAAGMPDAALADAGV